MKTPKRTKVDLYQCPECGSFAVLYDIEEKKEYLKCNTCGRVHHKSFFMRLAFENAIFTRWKRKNREARLRNKIKTITQKRNNALMAVVKLMQLKNETLGGMYGQDVEGS